MTIEDDTCPVCSRIFREHDCEQVFLCKCIYDISPELHSSEGVKQNG